MSQAQSIKLSKIAEVLNGYQERKRLKVKEHFVYSIQPKDIEKDSLKINESNLEKHFVPKEMDKYLLQKNDVLFLHRLNFRAAYLADSDFVDGKQYVPLQNLLILRVDERKISKGYLSWYLNQGTAQNEINRRIEGSTLPYISRKEVMDLNIDVPNLETQKKVVELYNLRLREKKLISEIQKKKDLLINQILKNSLKN